MDVPSNKPSNHLLCSTQLKGDITESQVIVFPISGLIVGEFNHSFVRPLQGRSSSDNPGGLEPNINIHLLNSIHLHKFKYLFYIAAEERLLYLFLHVFIFTNTFYGYSVSLNLTGFTYPEV